MFRRNVGNHLPSETALIDQNPRKLNRGWSVWLCEGETELTGQEFVR